MSGGDSPSNRLISETARPCPGSGVSKSAAAEAGPREQESVSGFGRPLYPSARLRGWVGGSAGLPFTSDHPLRDWIA